MLSLVPSSEFGAAICVRAGIARVSEDFVGHISHVFHLWWDGLFVSAATWGFLPKSFVGFALTAVGSIVLVENVMEYQIIRSPSRTNAFIQYCSTQPIW